MKIAVCIKQVVTREWQLRVNESKTWIRDQDASFELNEPDAYALEEALRLKEKHEGEVIVCSQTYDEIQDKVDQGRSLTVMCKGFEQPQRVWEIQGLKRDKVEAISSTLVTPPVVTDAEPPAGNGAPASQAPSLP